MNDNKSKLHSNEEHLFEINLYQIFKYLYSHRLIILTFTFAFPALVGMWLFFVKKPSYHTAAVLNLGVQESVGGFSGGFGGFGADQERNNRLYLLEQLFLYFSSEFNFSKYMNLGCLSITIDPRIFPAFKIFLLISAAFACRIIIFGG